MLSARRPRSRIVAGRVARRFKPVEHDIQAIGARGFRLRMAVGANGRTILAQFLAESVVLTVIGGSIGIVLGLTTAKVVALRFNMSVPLNPAVIAIAVGFSAAVGVGFGLYPALKAARMDPIDALKFE
jgi:putative ABC transport system permease protein